MCATGNGQSELPAAAGHLLTVKLGARLRSEGTPGPQAPRGALGSWLWAPLSFLSLCQASQDPDGSTVSFLRGQNVGCREIAPPPQESPGKPGSWAWAAVRASGAGHAPCGHCPEPVRVPDPWEAARSTGPEALPERPPAVLPPQLLSQKEFCPERQTVWFQRCTARLHPTPIVLESEPRSVSKSPGHGHPSHRTQAKASQAMQM